MAPPLSGSLLRPSQVMNPVQQHAPSPEELHLTALEQALTDSKAREEETQKQLVTLIDRFKCYYFYYSTLYFI